ncbi:methylated-DNA--[protein]-cysteine S-methyltransferase [Porticoccaceae bacterium]|jgi:AraC family transcriptional regulator of adaptative response/methylated-DNA-[protein]-cysteine methyltransferase|nr:methylated-DNA--[protein]-cysteine S-methyltransferase [Porticoccaceae bacterium]
MINPDYQRIAEAVAFLTKGSNHQSTLDDIAEHLGSSTLEVKRVFERWSRVSPKNYLQTITPKRGKNLLRSANPLVNIKTQPDLIPEPMTFGYKVRIEGWLPSFYKSGPGYDLTIDYSVHQSPFGEMFVAQTPRGICNVSFSCGKPLISFVSNLQRLLPEATLRHIESEPIEIFESIFAREKPSNKTLRLHLFALPTHISVWRTIMSTDPGTLTHHEAVAEAIGRRKSTQATHSAILANPIAFFIPSHRAIEPNGGAGEYPWGITRKHAIHAWESANGSF